MLKEVHFLTDTLTYFTRTEMVITFQSITLFHKEISGDSLPQTHTFQSLQYLGLNLDTLRLIQTLLSCGKPSLETLQTVLRSSLISSLHQEKLNGMSEMAWLCSCLMAMMELVQSIPHAELRDTCKCATKTKSCLKTQKPTIDRDFSSILIWKFAGHQLPQTTSIF